MSRPLLARLRRWFAAPARPSARHCRLAVEPLEDRLTPAFDLSINTIATLNVTQADNAGVRTFTASAIGATLNVADIKTALLADLDVVVTTGTAGLQNGGITWVPIADLDVHGIASSDRTLSLLPDASALAGTIIASADIFDSVVGDGEFLNVVMDAAAGGSVDMTGGVLTAVQDVVIDAGANLAQLDIIDSQGNQTITGSIIRFVAGGAQVSAGDQAYNGNLILQNVNKTLVSFSGDITVTGTIEGMSADLLTITATAGAVNLLGAVGGGGQIAALNVAAAAINLAANVTLTSAAPAQVNFTGDLSTTGSRVITVTAPAGSEVNFADGDVTLGGNLNINFSVSGNVLIDNGTFNAQAHPVTVANGSFTIGDGNDPATYAGTGTLQAPQVQVSDQSRLAPGGNGGAGNLAVTGAVTILAGGILDIDLGATPDQLNVTGTINISVSAVLDGSGTLTAVGPFTILTSTTLFGTFAGTTGEFVLGEDAVTASYVAVPNTLQITQVAADPNTVTGLTSNGDFYTVKKTGAGELVVVDDAGLPGIEGVVVRGSSATTTLSITVTQNGGTGLETVKALRVDGPIKSITATNVNLDGDHRIEGKLPTLKIRDLIGSLSIGGTASQLTSITGRQFDGDITMTSKLNVLTINEYVDGTITAPTIGTITTTINLGANLNGDFNPDLVLDAGSSTAKALSTATIAGRIMSSTWDVRGKLGTITVKDRVQNWDLGTTGSGFVHADQLGAISKLKLTALFVSSTIHSIGHITTLTTGHWNNNDLTAASVGTLKSTANTLLGLPGGFLSSTVTLTSFVNPGKVALGTFAATGTVEDSTFNILAGNVTSFTVGKFLSSNLYVGLSTGGSLLTGTFTGNFKIGTFKTTATPLVPPTPDPATDAFADSEVCASKFTTVRLSGVNVNNSAVTFGLRVASVANAGSVRVSTTPFPVNVNIFPGTTQTDFQFVAIA